MEPETVGQRLRRTRMRRVFDQQELGHRAGVSNVTISRIENGSEGTSRLSTIRKLADALDVSAAWLLYGEDPNEGKLAA